MTKSINILVIMMSAMSMSLIACGPDIPVYGADGNEDGGSGVEILLHSNDGTQTVKKASMKKDAFAEPAWIPDSRKGYTFSGWFLDESCTQLFDFSVTKVDKPMDLYAGWSRDIILKDEGKVARVTGATLSGETLRNPNNTHLHWNLGGTDLGIIWEIKEGKYGLFFGDSYGSDFRPVGGGPSGTDWRSNVLAFTENSDLAERGIVFSGMLTDKLVPDRAKPIIERPNYYNFTPIPTAAIEIDGVQYMHYMYWEVASTGRWEEVYSSIYKSEDDGQTWTSCIGDVRFGPHSSFGMIGYAKRQDDPYCYMLGAETGSGYRQTPGKVGRFLHKDILNQENYEYWNGYTREWVKDESKATVVLDGTVGELSVMWLEEYNRFLTLYFDSERYAVCYRSSARINGPWSEERILCSGWDNRYAQLYGSYIHPLSTKKGSDTIFWTMSQWQPYNVFLLKAKVSYAPEK